MDAGVEGRVGGGVEISVRKGEIERIERVG